MTPHETAMYSTNVRDLKMEIPMQVSVTEAKGQLPDLVRRAEAGDEVIPTRNGHATVRLVPIKTAPDKKTRLTLLEALRVSASPTAGPSAARSQDFLYGADGLTQ